MDKIECIVKAIDEKLGRDIVAIDMREASPLFDTFIICSANNERLIQSIKENIVDKCEENGFEIKRVEGYRDSKWVLIDAGDVVCHVFDKEERKNYNLEKLWGDLPRIDISAYLP